MNALLQAIYLLANAGTCNAETSNLLGFPNWYRGLQCEDGGSGNVVFLELNDLWVIVANVLEISLRIAGVVAVLFLIYGGIRYIMSQGVPENIQSAKRIIINAVVGLVLAIVAASLVGFVAGSF